MSLKRINHGNENHTPGFVEDTGDTMTGDLNLIAIRGVDSSSALTIYAHSGRLLFLGGNGSVQLVCGNTPPTTNKCVINLDYVFFPVQAPTVSAPTYVKGGMYFDTTLNKLRIGGATDWETVTSS